MKKTKIVLSVLLFALAISICTSCKKDKIKVQTELPAEYSNQGTINVAGKNLSVCIYDNSIEDGDIIDLWFNGNALIEDYELKIEERCFNVTLNEGDNWIGIKVDNEGTDPPASVTVKINDGATEQQFAIDGEINQPGAYIIKL